MQLAQFVVHHATDSKKTTRVECLRCHHICQIFKCRFAVGILTTDRLLGELFFTFSEKRFSHPFITGAVLQSGSDWDILPWSQTFFLNFPCMREPRSGEYELRSGEKEKHLVTLDLNLTFMQTLGS